MLVCNDTVCAADKQNAGEENGDTFGQNNDSDKTKLYNYFEFSKIDKKSDHINTQSEIRIELAFNNN